MPFSDQKEKIVARPSKSPKKVNKKRTKATSASTRTTARSKSTRVSKATRTTGSKKTEAVKSPIATSKQVGVAPLAVEALRWCCDQDDLPFSSTAEVEPAQQVLGQETALEALRFGLTTTAPGQNVFVRGPAGTGRLSLVKQMLAEVGPRQVKMKDCCYVHNFTQPDRPRLIRLPAGKGRAFRRVMDRFADFVRNDLATALTSQQITARRSTLERKAQSAIKEVVKPFEDALSEAGLALVTIQAGPVTQTTIFPVFDEKPVPPEEFEQLHQQGKLSQEEYDERQEKLGKFADQLHEINKRVTEIRNDHEEGVGQLVEREARSILGEFISEFANRFDFPGVSSFLEDVVNDVVENHLEHLASEEFKDVADLYRVNLVLRRDREDACPIVIEKIPTLRNLIGTIDKEYLGGDEVRMTHMGIRAGSLLQADGGYLVIEDKDIFHEPHAWRVLMRSLRTGQVEITLPEHSTMGWIPSLKPEPISIDVKVVLIGEPQTHYVLDSMDNDFPELFKVLADFDSNIVRNLAGVNQYAAVLSLIASEEGLPSFDKSAVVSLASHGARIAGRAGKLTARFGRMADIAREAAFIAGLERRSMVTGVDVKQAVAAGRSRANLPSRHFREYVADGTIRIDVQGTVIGQVNGLAVLHSGPLTHGFPTRITATIGPGTAGVINIEREAALSGAIHTKGFYILEGLLRTLLRTDHPLAFNASIAFEQSYGGIDGDSASGAEICCLLSALTGIPLRQDVAMTGAIDQKGHILAIGAVNEKIEGYYDACRELGLTGTQGVIIPKSNAGDLMLREDVVEACRRDEFRVWAIETVHEALELFTGILAGTISARGEYPKQSLLGQAVARARRYWQQAAKPSVRK